MELKELHFKGILFDVDDTLFNRRIIFSEWLDRYITDILKITDDALTSEIVDKITCVDGAGYGSKKELIETTLLLYPPPQSSGYNAELAYKEFFESSELDTEAQDILIQVEAFAIPYGIVTNGTSRQVEKTNKLGLTDRVGCLFVSHTFGSAKPDPEIFLAAAKCLGLPPHEILFVGDHPINDIYGAKNVGMMTAWVTNGQTWPSKLNHLKPDHILEQLSDLSALTTSR